MLKTKLINVEVMKYKECNIKNDNPPHAMRNVPTPACRQAGSFSQLELLVRRQLIHVLSLDEKYLHYRQV